MNERIPRVSVVIPVYNSMPYLTGTLESLVAQDLRDIEIIAINDGSTDGSGAELDRFAARDDRITVVHQENSGWPGMPRNRGLERAGGRYVLFMDADDTMVPHALRVMADQADDAEADVVIPRFAGTGGRHVQALFERHPEGPISLERAMESLSPQKLFRRDMLEAEGLRFPEGKVRLEDGIFVTRAYVLARRILFSGTGPLYLIALRDDGGNISSQAIEPQNYVSSCRSIAETLRAGVPDVTRSTTLIRQFFTRKGLRFYAPKRWLLMDSERQHEWVELHRAFLNDFLPESSDARIAHPTDRLKLELIRAGDVPGLDRLIASAPELDHLPRALGARAVPGGLELTISMSPTSDDSPLRSAGSGIRARLADRVYRTSRPYLDRRVVRGGSRWIARLLTGDAAGATLLLAGRKVARAAAIPGRLAYRADASSSGDTDGPSYRFVVPNSLLRRYGADRVDLWTVARSGRRLSGERIRVTADRRPAREVADVRLYTTDRGNLSLHGRAARRSTSD